MLTVDEALAKVLLASVPLPPIRCELERTLGCCLAEDVHADRESPPFNKALVDGYAVCSSDWLATNTAVRLAVIEHVPAGRIPTKPVQPGLASFVMTGAPLPAGADAMVMREYAEPDGDHVILAPPRPPAPGTHWMPQGRELAEGAIVALAGSRIDAVRLGVFASVGASRPWIWPRPRVTILSTGDELVPHHLTPGPGQIRNSKSVLLEGLVRQAGADALVLETAADEASILAERLAQGLDPAHSNVFLVSGGVSAGTHDLVPGILEQLGVEPNFHKLRMKPGKPLFFGLKRTPGQSHPVLTFGLPGNPVSVLVGFLNFVLPCLHRLGGHPPAADPNPRAILTSSFSHRGDRPTYYPCRLEQEPTGVRRATPLAWAGSSDLITLSRADALVVFPAGDRDYAAGESLAIVKIPGRD